jgi:hypothetical protein
MSTPETEPEIECKCENYQDIIIEIAHEFATIRRTIIDSVIVSATSIMNDDTDPRTQHTANELYEKHNADATAMIDNTNDAFVALVMKMIDHTTAVTVKKIVQVLVAENRAAEETK